MDGNGKIELVVTYYKKMKTVIANDKNLEKHGLFVKFIRIFSVPILNNLPDFILKKFMKDTSRDAEEVVKNAGSAKALEVMYGRYRRKLFSRGLTQGLSDLFWHHFLSQPKSIRNRLKIVENNLDKEIFYLINKKQDKEINILTIGGGSARGILEVLNKYSNELKRRKILVINIDKSLKAIELGKCLAKEFGLFDNFKWVNDLAQNIKLSVANNSIDIGGWLDC